MCWLEHVHSLLQAIDVLVAQVEDLQGSRMMSPARLNISSCLLPSLWLHILIMNASLPMPVIC